MNDDFNNSYDDREILKKLCKHEWEKGTWGVIFGASRCLKCGSIALSKDFPRADNENS